MNFLVRGVIPANSSMYVDLNKIMNIGSNKRLFKIFDTEYPYEVVLEQNEKRVNFFPFFVCFHPIVLLPIPYISNSKNNKMRFKTEQEARDEVQRIMDSKSKL